MEVFITLNTSILNKETNQYVVKRGKIFFKYLRTWLIVDIMAIIPRFIGLLYTESSAQQLFGFFKFARVSRVFKLVRLMKLIKATKQKELPDSIKLSSATAAFERIFLFVILCIVTIHTTACIWIFIFFEHEGTTYKDENNKDVNVDTWVDAASFSGLKELDLYFAAIYFTVTTFTTVGYGDISAKNTPERLLGCATMIIGVVAFSYATGAASSLISNTDAKNALYKEKMHTLKKLNDAIKMDSHLLREIQAFIKFSTDTELEERETLLQEIPSRLRARLSIYMYNNLFKS